MGDTSSLGTRGVVGAARLGARPLSPLVMTDGRSPKSGLARRYIHIALNVMLMIKVKKLRFIMLPIPLPPS